MTVEVRPITDCAAYRADWQRLFTGYVNFYKREMTPEIADRVWAWLQDPAHTLEGLMAFVDGKPAGIAHFRTMPRPMAGTEVGFLDDLFVDPEIRGHRIGEVLLNHLAEIARQRDWAIVRWLTADDNYRARALYDRLATKSGFNLYEMKI